MSRRNKGLSVAPPPSLHEKLVEHRRAVEQSLAADMKLRVPLHGEHIARAPPPDRLDYAVGIGTRLHIELMSKLTHGLMVDRVHHERIRAREQAAQQRALFDPQFVKVLVIFFGIVVGERA